MEEDSSTILKLVGKSLIERHVISRNQEELRKPLQSQIGPKPDTSTDSSMEEEQLPLGNGDMELNEKPRCHV